MKGFPESDTDPIDSSSRKSLGCCNSPIKSPGSVSGEAEPGIGCSKHQKSAPLWSGIWPPAVSIFGHSSGSPKKSDCSSVIRKKSASGKNYYEAWRAAVRRVMMNGGSMRRYLGFNRTNVSNSNSDIWLLGVCYHVAQEGEESSNPTQSEGFAAFIEDFSSRVLITYRKGFSPIGDSKYSSDVNWGCMLRSSQMLVAQAFLVHKLGRSWRKSSNKPLVESYMEILHLFGDAEDSPFSIHNLLEAGSAYGLAAGSWVGPYAMCRTWESLVRGKREESDGGVLSSMMGLYVVSGDEDGERGGAPVLCIEDISRYCSEFSRGQADWVPILLMVPLVLGLEKVNPRYLPLLCATFKFPQSLGILGGRPGASTYIVGVQDEKAFYLDPHEVQQFSPVQMDNVVGRDDEENTIINFLMKPEPGVISIVGVGGLGKSTLARKIYVNTRIAYEFPVRIWIHISDDIDDILRNILRVFTSQDMHSLSHEELSENVQACLKKKKFLLVLDNIRNLDEWEAIKVVLPNSNNMGKVLITTRTSSIGETPNFNINLRFLDAEESWKLLQLKLFGNLEHCPFELEAAGRSLARTCNGLPLNIVLVGGILKISGTPYPIKDVLKLYENVNMEPFNVVRLAYMRLSDELRQCFLYMGVFPEDHEISAWTLTRLWIAEGFVQQFHNLEEAATRNLDCLIGMNLVMVDKINPLGKVKTCRVHNIVRSFLLREAEEQELFQWLSLVHKVSICRRLCVDSYANINLLSEVPKSPGVRSVLCFSEPPPTGMDPSYTSTILNTFDLLKVLDSKSIKIRTLPQQITKLLHLRYVTLSVDIINTIPEPLSELWNLETLVVDTKSRVITMEANIWRLIWLRHLKTNATIILPSYNEDLSSNIGEDQSLAGENNLQTLTRLSPESCTTDVSERARNLKSLGIRGDLQILFGKMFLERFDLLEKLKLIHDVFPKMSSENPLHQLPPRSHFPQNLKWLTLSHTHLLWDRDMPTLADIDTLEVLKLKDDAFTGVIWRAAGYGFPFLKFFLIENTDLVLWKASKLILCTLRCLVLKNCENLREIPEVVAENLERLEIERLGKSAVDSARRIADKKQQAQEKKKTDFPFKLYIGRGCY